jgi:hypothetical protein
VEEKWRERGRIPARRWRCEEGKERGGTIRWLVEEKVGSWPWRALELGALDMSGTGSGSGSPRTTAPGHAQGRQGKREKGESGGGGGWLVGQLTEWASSREKRRAKSLRVDRPGGEGPAGKEREGEGAAAMRGPWGLNYKMNFDINFKSVPTWFESKPVFPTQKNQNKIWL